MLGERPLATALTDEPATVGTLQRASEDAAPGAAGPMPVVPWSAIQRLPAEQTTPLVPAAPTTPSVVPGPRRLSFADAGEAAVLAGIAARRPDGSVVFFPPGGDEPAVQRLPLDGPDFATATTAGTAPAGATTAAAAPPPAAATDANPMGAAAANSAVTTSAAPAQPSAAPGPATTEDLEALARRLYPVLRPMLRHELWLGLERAGNLIARGQ